MPLSRRFAPVKRIQHDINVECDTMETNPPANRNANAPNFFICDPHASVHGVPLSHNPPVLSRADNNLLKSHNDNSEVAARSLEVDDGVHNKLAWPVICNITASFHMNY